MTEHEKDAEIERLKTVIEEACQTFEHNGQHFYASKYRARAAVSREESKDE